MDNSSVLEKQLLYKECLAIIESKIATCRAVLADLNASSQSETKSSAGDKFETSREMLRQEAEKAERQLRQLNRQKNELALVKSVGLLIKVTAGALVITSHGKFYISSAIGKVLIEEEGIFVISVLSPMAKGLWGKRAGDTISLNERTIEILEVS